MDQKTNNRLALIAAGISGFVGVSAGAFGAHGLAKRVSDADLSIWGTASQYQLFHAVALLAVAAIPSCKHRRLVVWSWIVGTLLFSGSLYVLVLSGIRKLGMITPLGGLCFLFGWAVVFSLGLKAVKEDLSP